MNIGPRPIALPAARCCRARIALMPRGRLSGRRQASGTALAYPQPLTQLGEDGRKDYGLPDPNSVFLYDIAAHEQSLIVK